VFHGDLRNFVFTTLNRAAGVGFFVSGDQFAVLLIVIMWLQGYPAAQLQAVKAYTLTFLIHLPMLVADRLLATIAHPVAGKFAGAPQSVGIRGTPH
jgi:hypothetical protein